MGLPRPGRVLVAQGELAARVAELGGAIARDYGRGAPVLVGALQGAVPFVADLMRRLPIDLTVDFVRTSSYGAGTTSAGTVRLLVDLTIDIADRDVLIVDDIVDTGLTLAALQRTVEARGHAPRAHARAAAPAPTSPRSTASDALHRRSAPVYNGRAGMNQVYKNLALWMVIGLIVILLFTVFQGAQQGGQEQPNFSEFLKALDQGRVES